MRFVRNGYVIGPALSGLWCMTVVVVAAIAIAFMTGNPARPSLGIAMLLGLAGGLLPLLVGRKTVSVPIAVIVYSVLAALEVGPLQFGESTGILTNILSNAATAGMVAYFASRMIDDLPWGTLTRHETEHAVIRFLTAFGLVVFTTVVLVPFFVMVATSLKSQQALLLNPLDYSIDLSKGWDLLRSYRELFTDFRFGGYLWISFVVSVVTVAITLVFSVPGAYAVARLRFKGQREFSQSILFIYMVPMIVLALPVYMLFSMTGLRNSVFGLMLIYPVTTIPVALYILQGYFRGIPYEIEEAGLMDGLSRFQVIRRITLPLSLPSLASVSLYVFMIAWNEFLLAFMLLDDPAKFTLTRGVAMLNSSEIPRQHLMAGSVIATIPVLVLFLGLERFITKGLTAGSVKG